MALHARGVDVGQLRDAREEREHCGKGSAQAARAEERECVRTVDGGHDACQAARARGRENGRRERGVVRHEEPVRVGWWMHIGECGTMFRQGYSLARSFCIV